MVNFSLIKTQILLLMVVVSISMAEELDCVNEDLKTVGNFGIFLVIFGIFLMIFGAVMLYLQYKASKNDTSTKSLFVGKTRDAASPSMVHKTAAILEKDPFGGEYDKLKESFRDGEEKVDKDGYHDVWL